MIAVFACAPLGINLSGTSVFIYLQIGNKDLVFAASEGVSHNALTDHFEFDEYDVLLDPYFEEASSLPPLQGSEYALGPLRAWIERGGGFRPYRFSVSPDRDYFAIEFPWLLIPAVLAGLGFWRYRVSKRKVSE